MQLVFATNNHNKVREINNILGDSFNLLSLGDLGLNEDIPENEPTIEGNALHKARYIYDRLKIPVFADDTGLEIDALDGLPGVHSARFAGGSKDSAANIEKVLALMKDSINRTARFRTVIALIINDHEYIFEGTVEGSIISEKRGSEGFGYDPVFVPEGQARTFAEMPLSEKNLISHRARAFEQLITFLNNFPGKNNKSS
ncbi:MAG TPA: RdgB/HAM1 family non-canonical purine NTP pyrophosphatase [Bacteroidales bacterium]|nr:RdgB/HAM1 family non-canonical purine NTP pyrophosphatase [Bacteroidales bacterium]HPF01903.1 RdgB/HAM1 family non-canonical purine NTP pyrophosphatase [Bacteroidales bacterium]HPJ60166.1 RdgB/HAM1 family non-canonical purine NTP pyrophosphatase [Bacteroidales bacterium]HPR13351.1 RdgB/HAM1 family non-canonical purine NTP pyrophosphatase [Bacteroidales bacterium]HRW83793.1 RdgB/HAM1 family non-canonical purine NTP pyrophosphatase [Bacteroidales bacterium]